MLNRTIAPASLQVNNINFIEPAFNNLANGIPLYSFCAGDQGLVRIEFIFNNVNWDANKPLQAVAVNSLINNGTTQLTAKQIAEKIDYYGAFFQSEYGAEQITITLYSLSKHLAAVLPIVKAIFNESIFPSQELAIFIQNQKQKLQVNLQKNDFLARKTFANALFGDTPYGSDINAVDYDLLNREDLIAYYKAAFKPENCTIIASGKIDQQEINLIDEFFGGDWANKEQAFVNSFNLEKTIGKQIHVERADAVQSAIRMGKIAINRTHQEFPSLQVLNTLLGGYFGSRLMANIREDKGYTYGIGSGVASLKNTGYFFIATEVGVDVCNAALIEIGKEITALQQDLVSEDELNLVRNYMLGSMLGSLENIFSHADKFKNIHFSGLDYNYYQNYIQTVKTITPAELLKLAQKYLNQEDFVQVVVGKV